MGVRNYLIDGVSGTGKTAVADELARRGYHVIHGDRVLAFAGDPETGEPLEQPAHLDAAVTAAWLNTHWIWPVDRIKALAADRSHRISFFCGASRNSRQFLGLFDKVFALDVDLRTLQTRLARRPENEFGGMPAERELIERLHATQEDIPAEAVRIDANGAVSAVVDAILVQCGEKPGSNAKAGR